MFALDFVTALPVLGILEQAGRSSGRVDDFIYYSRDPVYCNYASVYNNDRKAGNGNDQKIRSLVFI